MSRARTEILAAIRAVAPGGDVATVAAAAKNLRARIDATRPDRICGPLDEVFLARLLGPGIAATAERIETLAEFPHAVRRYLAAHQLAPSAALQPHPSLAALDWTGITTHPVVATDEPVAIAMALGAIAETGSLVFQSGPSAPTLFSFLPLHHIVAVEAGSIWPWLEDYADTLQGPQPCRNVNLITGASGTTDIEGTLVRGAHGPGWLHAVLVG